MPIRLQESKDVCEWSRAQGQNAIHNEQTTLEPKTGATEDGVPLAFNRPAVERLEPWVGRAIVAVAEGPRDTTLHGLLCNDASYLRSAVDVDWSVETADGLLAIRDATFLCGQHSRAMPLSYCGGIKVAGLMLRPGALHTLFGLEEAAMVDRIQTISSTGIRDEEVTGLYSPDITPQQWLERLEDWLATRIAVIDPPPPDPLSQAFELQAFEDPNESIHDFAEAHNVSVRTLERAVKRDFGLNPKQVMRRARILDLAARLCGVADKEEEDILLRFFDEAHRIREFKAFFGMTPGIFKRNRSGLLTLSLEIRQARRLELLEKIKPGAVRPWMRRAFQPAPDAEE
ncbi:helix-turn-helix domain-containing protein [Qipengyuania sp. 1XM1-15A]|uniref:helix-turn-helix domain-containing protein n=1 Tax=Qipengyuania xiamenensis TaxID=2867237 RepID=UPI001C8760DB|nr:helix-turn-helix domain-containing protein [Qipengyuania xiamenensis]MBX7532566.1 helix-turn-helix domain-containing protein [Qipengyuania xiamenensis]